MFFIHIKTVIDMDRVMKRIIENMVIATIILFITTIQIYYFNPFPPIQPIDTNPQYEHVMVYNTSKLYISNWKPIFTPLTI